MIATNVFWCVYFVKVYLIILYIICVADITINIANFVEVFILDSQHLLMNEIALTCLEQTTFVRCDKPAQLHNLTKTFTVHTHIMFTHNTFLIKTQCSVNYYKQFSHEVQNVIRTFFVSTAKHGRHIGIMTLSASSSASESASASASSGSHTFGF